MTSTDGYMALIRHAAESGDWHLARLLADFLENEPSRNMIASCCAYITLCEELDIAS